MNDAFRIVRENPRSILEIRVNLKDISLIFKNTRKEKAIFIKVLIYARIEK